MRTATRSNPSSMVSSSGTAISTGSAVKDVSTVLTGLEDVVVSNVAKRKNPKVSAGATFKKIVNGQAPVPKLTKSK